MELTTLMYGTTIAVHILDNVLSFNENGPKSTFQAVIWIGHKLYKKAKQQPRKTENIELDQLSIEDILI